MITLRPYPQKGFIINNYHYYQTGKVLAESKQPEDIAVSGELTECLLRTNSLLAESKQSVSGELTEPGITTTEPDLLAASDLVLRDNVATFVYDLGSVEPGVVCKRSLSLRNPFRAEFEVSRTVQSCSCLDFEVSSNTLTSSGALTVDIELETDANGTGKLDQKCMLIDSRDPLRILVLRLLAQLPKDFKIGETWVFLAHCKAIQELSKGDKKPRQIVKPGIFFAYQPKQVHLVVYDIDNIPEKAFEIAKNAGEEHCRIVEIVKEGQKQELFQ